MVLVSHDLGVVAGHTDEIAVMYAGQIVEQAPTKTLFAKMRMPYTAALLESIPRLENASHTRLNVIAGRPPDLIDPPRGLPLRAALPVRPGPLPRGAATADRGRRAGPHLPLLVPGRHGCGQGGAGAEPGRARPPGRRSAVTRCDVCGRCRRLAGRSGKAPDGRQRDRTPAAGRRHAPPGREPGRGLPGRAGPPRLGGGQREPRRRRARDAGPRGRVRLRQVHDRPGRDPAAQTHGRQGDVRRPRAHGPQRGAPAGRRGRRCRSCSRTRSRR